MASKSLFDRKWKIVLNLIEEGESSMIITKTKEITDLKVKFNITNTLLGDPSLANFQIYNINSETEAFLTDNKCTISMYAGYYSDADWNLLFEGEITNSYRLREDVDLVWNVWARNSYTLLNIMKPTTLVKQTPITTKEAVLMLLADTPRLSNIPTYIGTAEAKLILAQPEPDYTATDTFKKEFDELILSAGLGWQIQENKLVIFDKEDVTPLVTEIATIEVSPLTGLLSYPTVDYTGVKFTNLLNGKFVPTRIINIAPNTIKYDLGNEFYIKKFDKEKWRASGKFRIYEVKHSGDTRGDLWKSDVTAFYRRSK